MRPPLVESYRIEACMLSDVGNHREHNEDRVLYVTPGDAAQLERRGMLAIVADGMGGHQAGEVASQMAIDTINQTYYRSEADDPLRALRNAFSAANRAIHEASLAAPDLHGMGTTGTALALQGGQAYFAHVGDSRLYQVRNSELTLLSDDQTLVMELVRAGALSLEQARNHPKKHVILRALGTQPSISVSAARVENPPQPGDRFILCSDGLHDVVADDELREAVVSLAPEAACAKLVALARARDSDDNISIGVLAISETVPRTAPLPITGVHPAVT